ncbi:MAG: hypothetical protein LBE99_01335 [Puniceicoccales bacterium]|nr:hypothetical protein [Puniceicoccales bacterium]
MREHLPQWDAAAQLRQAIADGNPNLAHLAQMVTTPLGTEGQQMGFNDLPAVAQYLYQNHNRPLVVIDTTTADHDFMFTYYNQNGRPGLAADFSAALNGLDGPPIVLLYTPGHWNAVVPTQSQNAPFHEEPSPDDLCGCVPWSRV